MNTASSYKGRRPGADPFEAAAETARLYGFNRAALTAKHVTRASSFESLISLREPLVRNGSNESDESTNRASSLGVSIFASGFASSESQPLMYYYCPICGEREDERGSADGGESDGQTRFCLEIVGNKETLAEILLIKTITAVLADNEVNDIALELNTIGGQECSRTFLEECSVYYRRRASLLGDCCRRSFRENILKPLTCGSERCAQLREECPNPIDFLDESGRRHFKEILEYLELTGTPYRVNPRLFDGTYKETIFEIKDGDSESKQKRQARGGKREIIIQNGKEKKFVPAIGATVFLVGRHNGAHFHSVSAPKKPDVHFIRLGREATLKGFAVVEILRRARLRLYQSPFGSRLSGEIALAEENGVPYTVIMGQKEALKNIVVFRETESRSQETVPVRELAKYLKKIKFSQRSRR